MQTKPVGTVRGFPVYHISPPDPPRKLEMMGDFLKAFLRSAIAPPAVIISIPFLLRFEDRSVALICWGLLVLLTGAQILGYVLGGWPVYLLIVMIGACRA